MIYHVGRPGEDGFVERVLLAWGVDGHNSHTNICSAGARLGYTLWGGYDRPSPDYANARVILLISSHLETGHYFNPHAQRIMEGKVNGNAKLVVLDPRLSNTAVARRPLDEPVAGQRGGDPAGDRVVPAAHRPGRVGLRPALGQLGHLPARAAPRRRPRRLRGVQAGADRGVRARTPSSTRPQEAQIPVEQVEELAKLVAGAEGRLAAHVWRAATAGNLGGWMVARALFFLTVLTGSVGTVGGTSPNGWNKFIPHGPNMPSGHDQWNEKLWPAEYPLSTNEMSILLPHLLKEGRGKRRRLLLPRLQPDLDQPRRVHLDRGAHRREPGRPARRADADLVGDGDVRRLRAARWATAPSGTTRSRTSSTAASGSASGSRCGGSRWSGSGRPVDDTRDANPGRGLGGERVLVRAVLADRPGRLARHPQVLRGAGPPRREGDRRRLLRLGLRQPGARAARRRRPATA